MLPFLKFLCMLGSVSALRMTMSGPGPSVQRIDVAPRQGLRHALALGASSLLLAAASRPTAVAAKVFFDTDTYGDKELKIATVNKIKQKLRNAILDDPALAPDLLRLSINDALSYNAQTEAYGPDGAIQFELDREENKGLAKAVEVVQRIKKELQRTNTVSFSDLVAFAGAEALETVGCDRVIVQVGRTDAKKEHGKDAKAVNWSNLDTASTKAVFATAGLTSRELVLLLGAVGEVTRVVAETAAAGAPAASDDDDCGIDGCLPDVATTFGARDAMYGSKLGKADFSTKFLAQLSKNSKKGGDVDVLAQTILGDDQAKTFVQKYAQNEAAFKKDVTDSYLALTQLGKAGTTRNS